MRFQKSELAKSSGHLPPGSRVWVYYECLLLKGERILDLHSSSGQKHDCINAASAGCVNKQLFADTFNTST